MSEKRFVLCKRGDVEYIEDNCCVQLYGFDVLCDLLNEQQATINSLKEENEQMKREIIKLGVKWRVLSQKNDLLREENEQLRKDLERLERNHQNLHEKYEEMEEQYKEYFHKYNRIKNNTI